MLYFQLGSIDVMHSARGRLQDVKDRMEATKIHSSMDNQAREKHHLTIQDIRDIQTVSNCRRYNSTNLYQRANYVCTL